MSIRTMLQGGRQAALLALVVAVATGCELASEPIKVPGGGIVVHAVLNPSVCEQLVFVEELHTGAREPEPSRDSDDQIRLAGGIPITDATVVVTRSTGAAATARQRLTAAGVPTGIYEIRNDRCPSSGAGQLTVQPGDSYELRVTTPRGGRVSGSTRIPRPGETPKHFGPGLYNVDTDSFRIQARPADFAHRYVLSVNNTRWGAITLRVEGPNVQVGGQLRYVDDFEESDVFRPGMLHRVVLTATDRHYGDYVTTWSDPLTGRGQVHGISGGYGLFGSVAPIGSILLDATADENHLVEGHWERSAPVDDDVPFPVLRLYVDDNEPADDWGIHLVGSVQMHAAAEREGLQGHLRESTITLTTTRGAAVWGELRGDSLVLDIPDRRTFVFHKRRGRTQ